MVTICSYVTSSSKLTPSKPSSQATNHDALRLGSKGFEGSANLSASEAHLCSLFSLLSLTGSSSLCEAAAGETLDVGADPLILSDFPSPFTSLRNRASFMTASARAWQSFQAVCRSWMILVATGGAALSAA